MFIHGWVWDLRKYLSWIGEVYNSPLIHTKYKFKLWLFYLYFHYKVCLWWSIVPFCNKLKCIEVSNIRSLLLSDSLRIDLVYTWNMCYYDGVAFGTENLLTTKYHTFSIGHFFRQFSLHYSRLTSKEGVKSFECWYFVLIFECQKIYLQRIWYHDY